MNQNDRWQRYFNALLEYTNTHRTSLVPAGYVHRSNETEAPLLLGNWVSHQRSRYRANKLNENRARMLETLPDWTWHLLPRGRRRDTVRDSRVIEMRNAGLSLAQIANEVGVSRQRIHQIVQRSEKSRSIESSASPGEDSTQNKNIAVSLATTTDFDGVVAVSTSEVDFSNDEHYIDTESLDPTKDHGFVTVEW